MEIAFSFCLNSSNRLLFLPPVDLVDVVYLVVSPIKLRVLMLFYGNLKN